MVAPVGDFVPQTPILLRDFTMRNYRVQVALTAEEKEHIEQLKEEYGYYSLSQTMRWMMFGKVHGERSPYMHNVSKHLYLLANAANNLNQIARSSNLGGYPDTDVVENQIDQLRQHSNNIIHSYTQFMSASK